MGEGDDTVSCFLPNGSLTGLAGYARSIPADQARRLFTE